MMVAARSRRSAPGKDIPGAMELAGGVGSVADHREHKGNKNLERIGRLAGGGRRPCATEGRGALWTLPGGKSGSCKPTQRGGASSAESSPLNWGLWKTLRPDAMTIPRTRYRDPKERRRVSGRRRAWQQNSIAEIESRFHANSKSASTDRLQHSPQVATYPSPGGRSVPASVCRCLPTKLANSWLPGKA